MDYAIDNLLDEKKCYDHLVDHFHAGHLGCPTCNGVDYHVHKNGKKIVPQFKCDGCGAYFNIYTNTSFQATRWSCSKVVSILRGFLKGESTLSISKELSLGYRNLLYLRHELMHNAFENRTENILPDFATESDEMYQNSGEKGILHPDPEDPPRCRANKKKGLELGRTTDPRSFAPSGGKAAKYV